MLIVIVKLNSNTCNQLTFCKQMINIEWKFECSVAKIEIKCVQMIVIKLLLLNSNTWIHLTGAKKKTSAGSFKNVINWRW